MNNQAVSQLLDDCSDELQRILIVLTSIGVTTNVAQFLNKYAIIRACGAVEVAYKSLVCDYCEWRSKSQVKSYLKNKVRESSSNPNYSNICKILKDFDEGWLEEFKTRLNAKANKSQIMTSIESLVDARNEFAHGGNPTSTVSDVISYFADCRIVLDEIDSIIG